MRRPTPFPSDNFPRCPRCAEELEWMPLSELNAAAFLAHAFPKEAGDKTMARCAACALFYGVGIRDSERAFALLGPVRFDAPASEQPFDSSDIEQAFRALERLPGALGKAATSLVRRLYTGVPQPAVRLTYADMVQIAEEVVEAVEDAILEQVPPAECRRPVPQPADDSPYYQCYTQYLANLQKPLDKVWGSLALLTELASQLHDVLNAMGQAMQASDWARVIQLCHHALTLVDREHDPLLWGTLHLVLADSLDKAPQSALADSFEEIILHYQQALEVQDRETVSDEWAAIQYNLGNTYRRRRLGEPAENLERAAHHYTQALQVYTRTAFPDEWARVQYNLGNNYRERLRGEPADNVEAAIDCYHCALQVRTRETAPKQWAAVYHNLGLAYLTRLRSDSADNVEAAIDCYHLALQVRTRAADPTDWADTQYHLMVAYTKRQSGEPAENIERAIGYGQEALTVYTQAAFPQKWAQTHADLAVCYRRRRLGERAENLERAIGHAQEALTVHTRAGFPKEWAIVQRNLMAVYHDRIHGARAENLEQAIECGQQALEVLTREAFPAEWAMTHDNLAMLYIHRLRGERADNLEVALYHSQQALTVFTQHAFPIEWAMAQNIRAMAYQHRVRSDNLEPALHYAQQALEIWTRESFPTEWANTQILLATFYADRRCQGVRSDNLEAALHHAQQALEVWTRQSFPTEWARVQATLATIHLHRQEPRADNLEAALHHAQQALEVWTRQSFPTEWANTHSNLALVYAERHEGSNSQFDKQHLKISKFGSFLKPFHLIHEVSLKVLGTFSPSSRHNENCWHQGARADNLALAIQHAQQALKVFTLASEPAAHGLVQRNLGSLHFGEQDWSRAHAACTAAVEAGTALLAVAYTEVGRRAAVAETAQLYANDAYCLLQLAQPGAALQRLEQGKTRLLVEALALGEADMATLPVPSQQALREARQTIQALEAEQRLPPTTPARRGDRELAAALRQARADLARLLEAIRAGQPDFLPTGLDLPGILALIPAGGALVVPLVTTQGAAVFVLPHGTETVTADHVLPLAHLDHAAVVACVLGTEHDLGWLPASYGWGRGQLPLTEWMTVIERGTAWMWNALMGPVYTRLQALGIARDASITLLPQGWLGLLPLHAAWREVDGVPRAFLEDYMVTYAPSAYALGVSHRRLSARAHHPPFLVAIVDPTEDLTEARAEGEAVAASFSPSAYRLLRGPAATREAVVQTVPGSTHVHFASHNQHDWREVMRSGLVLAGADTLTLADMLSQLDLGAVRLVTLSACDTGLIEFQQAPEEHVGLPAGLLQVGAPGVVSALWAVPDRATSLLMARFYQGHRRAGLPPSQALRQAQLALRKASRDWRQPPQTPSDPSARVKMLGALQRQDPASLPALEDTPIAPSYAHPWYWAAFTFTGA